MEIVSLGKKAYEGKRFTVRYKTNGYYDICPQACGFQVRYVPFETEEERAFDDDFFGAWLGEPAAFGAVENGELVGYVEGAPEGWNGRYRISNICVFDSAKRSAGIGTALIEVITKEAMASGARMMVLETQSCNENAIAFYKKHGFDIIGFDLYAYSNSDPERHEVRIEMGKKIG